MSPKEKTKTGALPSGRSKESDRQKEVERQKEIERLEKDVEELRHLAGNEDADAELGRIREQVGELRREVSAWEDERNERQVGVNWQFTTADARIKLRKLYPVIQT